MLKRSGTRSYSSAPSSHAHSLTDVPLIAPFGPSRKPLARVRCLGRERLDRVDQLRIKCEGIPERPTPPLGYKSRSDALPHARHQPRIA